MKALVFLPLLILAGCATRPVMLKPVALPPLPVKYISAPKECLLPAFAGYGGVPALPAGFSLMSSSVQGRVILKQHAGLAKEYLDLRGHAKRCASVVSTAAAR